MASNIMEVNLGSAEQYLYSGLSGDTKLPVLTSVSCVVAVTSAVAWAHNKFKRSRSNARDDHVTEMYCAGAAICIKAGLVRKVGDIPDGEWYDSGSELWYLHSDKSFVPTNGLMAKALNIIVATKLDWWLNGYHSEPQKQVFVNKELEYFAKVYYPKFRSSLPEGYCTMAHTIGSWASTIHVLDLVGISGLRKYSNPLHEGTINITLSPITRTHFLSAQTELMEVTVESAKLLMKSPLARLCPKVADFQVIPEMFFHNRAGQHIEATYLTGKPRIDYSIQLEPFFGRLGAYIRIMFEDSKLEGSRYFTKKKVESYPDYSPAWEKILTEYKKNGLHSVTAFEQVKMMTSVLVDDATLAPIRDAFIALIKNQDGTSGGTTSSTQDLQQPD